MTKLLTLSKGAEEGVRELLRFLLVSGNVKGVLTLIKEGVDGGVAFSLITDPNILEQAVPLYPVMPVNAAKVLSYLTWVESATEPIAVVIRPCELRALVELVKRKQGSMDNLILISPTCGGVYPLKMAVNGSIEENLPEYWEAVKKGEMASDVRLACTACDKFVPYNADITVSLVGNKDVDKQCVLSLNTDKGKQFTAGIAGELAEGELDSEMIKELAIERQSQKDKLFADLGTGNLKIEKAFEKCIGCRVCSRVCPICYCRVCFFDTYPDEHMPYVYEAVLEKKGQVPVFLRRPISYHFIRLSHISKSCIGCGLCADVCPVNIPIWAIALKTAESVQKTFGYLPGRDIEERLII